MQKSTEERLKALEILEIDAKNFNKSMERLETVNNRQIREINNLKSIVFLLIMNVGFMALLLIIQQPLVVFGFLLIGVILMVSKDITKTE